MCATVKRPGTGAGETRNIANKLADSGLASQVDVVARGYGTVVKWDWRQLVEFMASRPALRVKLLTLVSADLATKLREITIAVGLAVEPSAPR